MPKVVFGTKVACVVAAGLLASGCAQNSKKYAEAGNLFPTSKYGPASKRVIAEGEDVPKGGGQNLVGKPYTIAGHTYYPAERPNYSAVGMASWYGADFHGRKTANGEIFDKASVTAAHPTMPLPSYARVTNLRNGASIVVRVNDRGPYHGGRVMDVSEKVAGALDFKGQGTAKVKVEYLARAGLGGSDDNKLLASLRTDGSPATLDGLPTQPIMVAANPEPAQRVASLAQQAQPEQAVEQNSDEVATAASPLPSSVPLPVARPFNVGAPIVSRPLMAPSAAAPPVLAQGAAPTTIATAVPRTLKTARPVLDSASAVPAAAGKLSALYYNSDLPPIERFQKDGPFKKFHPRTMEDLLKTSN